MAVELTESIKSAWKAVQDSGVPEHVQEVAFKECLGSLLGSAPTTRHSDSPKTSASGGINGGNGDIDGDMPAIDEAEVVNAVAEETGVPAENLEQIFHVDQGVVKLIGSGSRFGSSTADKARNIALIVTVVRKLGMGKQDTSFEVIKGAVDSKHAYDSKNFAPRHMTTVTGCVVKGDSKSRRLEAKGAGISAFASVVDKVLGIS